MAQFFKNKPRNSKKMSPKMTLNISHLDHLGAGVAHHDGKVVFVPGALADETVELQFVEQKKKYAKGKLLKVVAASEKRVEPECPHFHRCGGCDLQHLDVASQRKYKAQSLKEIFTKLTQTEPDEVTMLEGQVKHYRRRAKLATYFDTNKKTLTLGFRQQSSYKIEAIKHCLVLEPQLSDLIAPLSETLNQLSGAKSLGHVELIAGENAYFVVIRTPKSLNNADKNKLKDFAQTFKLVLQLQNDTGFELIHGEELLPSYEVGQRVNLSFTPGNFVQVNGDINNKMIAQAIDWLEPQQDETIFDLFCGMGNFSLPVAQHCKHVIGVEGVASAVEQAKLNAKANDIFNAEFYECDLSADITKETWFRKIDKLLLDPARAGAFEALQNIKKLNPSRVVYVSCDPASLSRDSKLLIDSGYQLQKLSMIDMFPQTHHIEAMALFTK